ncbi:stabilizer of axonemal microtubules 1 isoform X1 [Ambystoma mexicanum]|uniref:stabilizer of axonemal microtubules 1 isoform X1 n=1 Tax=Ambystoma mexicanum TaxID=8296 RepID=UPI0037E748AE
MKCICQICICGRHHCPHLPTKIFDALEKPCLISEYVDQYLCRQSQPTKSFKPCRLYEEPTTKMDGLTTFREAYIPHKVVIPKFRHQDKYKPNNEAMDMLTTYKQEYNPYCVQKTASFRPAYHRPTNNIKMDTVATYTDDYKPWNEPKRDSMKPDNTYRPPGEAFATSTTFGDACEFKGPAYTKSCRPDNTPRISTTPFDNVSNYKDAYISHQVQKPKFHIADVWRPCLHPFDGLTINQRDFRGQPGDPAKSTKPENTRKKYDIPFCPSTECQDAYTKMPIQCRFHKKYPTYIPPVLKMDMVTTNQCAYTEHRIQIPKSFRPVHHGGRDDVPFEGRSVMKDDYRQWSYTRVPPVKPDQMLHLSDEPLECMTTSRINYVPHPPAHTLSCKPVGTSARHSEPMDAESMYCTTYTPKQIVLCPARFKDPEGYVFEGMDSSGHRQYSSFYDKGQRSSSKEETGNTYAVPEDAPPSKDVQFTEQPRKQEVVA